LTRSALRAGRCAAANSVRALDTSSAARAPSSGGRWPPPSPARRS